MSARIAKLALGFAAFAATNISTGALALPIATPADAAAAARSIAPDAADLRALDVDFTAIIALSNCSGALVRFTTSRPTDKAMVLTNGHCFEGGMPGPGVVHVDRSSTRTFRLLSSDGQQTLATLRAERVIYATMTDTDVTLYRTTSTFDDIKRSYGVDALTLSDHHPEAGTPIRVVSGYWKKIYPCNIDRFVYMMKEADWSFRDAIRYTQPGCEVIGGTSGSPVINADTKEVIGINNTINENGQRCTMNNPCEIDEMGTVTYQRGAAYGQETYRFYGCLTAENTLNLNLRDCTLPKP